MYGAPASADWEHGEPSLTARRGGSADVHRPLLSYRLSGSLWLGGQLKNRSLLTLVEYCQQHRPARAAGAVQRPARWRRRRRRHFFFVELLLAESYWNSCKRIRFIQRISRYDRMGCAGPTLEWRGI